MPPFQSSQGAISADLVTRVGTAAGHVARIQQEYEMQVQAETTADAREALTSRAQDAAARALDAQGISVQDYNAVLSAAEDNAELEQQLLAAAREVL